MCGPGVSTEPKSQAGGGQEAPLFLLFLDCVWQLSRQFPFSLEFGESLLLALFDNAYASDYGTFLCNNEKERRVLGDASRRSRRCLCKVKENTHSLWAWLNQPEEKKKYLNPLYSHNPLVIWPSVEPQSIQLWQGLFFRWIRPSQYLDEARAEMQRLVEANEAPAKESAGSRLSRSQRGACQGEHREQAEPVALRPRHPDGERKMSSSMGTSVLAITSPSL
ncbi:Myotubularin-related protein 9 [Anas platyrhynchos]|uniref:Myotubularin-related protein 9 n=1 Tax=Anas platyrhynchos TaxID=8839 RepID=R0JU27_ANAPL|nr:Myotubularin-related protein 9 [Anas platyrhynchos]